MIRRKPACMLQRFPTVVLSLATLCQNLLGDADSAQAERVLEYVFVDHVCLELGWPHSAVSAPLEHPQLAHDRVDR